MGLSTRANLVSNAVLQVKNALQIRCGDLYSDKAVATFTACAVSDKKCVPQKIDRDAFPEPKAELLDKDFDLNKFEVGNSVVETYPATSQHVSTRHKS